MKVGRLSFSGTGEQLAVIANRGESKTIRLTDYVEGVGPEGEPVTFLVDQTAPGWSLDIAHTSEGATLTARAGGSNAVARVTATDSNGACTKFPVNLIVGAWRCCNTVHHYATDHGSVREQYSCGCIFVTSSRWFDYSWIEPYSGDGFSLQCRDWHGYDRGEWIDSLLGSRVNSCGSGCDVGRAIPYDTVRPGGFFNCGN